MNIGIWLGDIKEDIRYPGAIGYGIKLKIRTIRVGDSDLANKTKKLSVEFNAHWIKNTLPITIII